MFTAIRAETAPFTNLPTSEGRAQKEGRAVTETSESSYYRPVQSLLPALFWQPPAEGMRMKSGLQVGGGRLV